MKAITLWQPWASLIACGEKKYETRSWWTNYRGPIAIHAAQKDPQPIYANLPIDVQFAISAVLLKSYLFWDNVPRGTIVATAELVECWEITDVGHTMGDHSIEKAAHIVGGKGRDIIISGNEILFGDWRPGRYAWELANVQMLPEPVPAKGKQGLWNWEGETNE